MELAHYLAERALQRGQVARHDRIVGVVPVKDDGIDLRRGRSRGVSGYEVEAKRRKQERVRVMEYINDAIRKAAAERELPPFNFDKPSVRVIIANVCKFADVQPNDICSARRTANIIKPRHIAMMLAKMLTLKSLPEIGRQFGGRDHTTVLHAVRKTEELQRYVRKVVTDQDEISLWVSAAFKGWDELGFK